MGFMTRLGLFGAVTSKQSAGSGGGGGGRGAGAGSSSSSAAASGAIVPAGGAAGNGGGGKAYAFETLGDFVKAMDQGGTSALEICAIDMKVRRAPARGRGTGGDERYPYAAYSHRLLTRRPSS
jgi:hypothetical protein